jgi:hypothetical protein
MSSMQQPLPAHPTAAAARRDWYRAASLLLAWVTLAGILAAILTPLAGLPEWFSRVGLTVAGLALAAHVAASVALSRTPRLDA